MLDDLQGQIERVTFHNDETGLTIARLTLKPVSKNDPNFGGKVLSSNSCLSSALDLVELILYSCLKAK